MRVGKKQHIQHGTPIESRKKRYKNVKRMLHDGGKLSVFNAVVDLIHNIFFSLPFSFFLYLHPVHVFCRFFFIRYSFGFSMPFLCILSFSFH